MDPHLPCTSITNISNLTIDCLITLDYSLSQDYGSIICGPILTIFIILGLMGSCIYLSIILKSRPIPVLNLYTIPLCFCDCAVLIGAFLMVNIPKLLKHHVLTRCPYVQIFPFLVYFSNAALASSIWITVSLSVERYFALCYPFKHMVYNAKKRSIVVSSLCILGAILFNIPRYFELTIIGCSDQWQTKNYGIRIEKSPFRNLKIYWILYHVILGKSLLSIGPFVFLCFLSIRMWRKLRHGQKSLSARQMFSHHPEAPPTVDPEILESLMETNEPQAQTVSPKQSNVNRPDWKRRSLQKKMEEKQTNALTVTLLCVVLKFLFCHTLPTAIDLCEALMEPSDFEKSHIKKLVDTSTLFIVINSSLNGFLCMWGNRQTEANERRVSEARRLRMEGPRKEVV